MSDSFKTFLEDLEKAPQPEAAPEAAADPAPDAPVGPPDPYAHLIGHAGPLAESSPFDAMLDAMADTDEAKEVEKEAAEREPDYGNHDWKSMRKTEFEDDQDVWRCQRCFRQVNIDRNETLEQACQRVNLNPNCGEQVAAEVMET